LAIAGAQRKLQSFTTVSPSFLTLPAGLGKYGPDIKKTLNELIEEEFTSRAFDNVKAAVQMVS
jgi:hypothetical protein